MERGGGGLFCIDRNAFPLSSKPNNLIYKLCDHGWSRAWLQQGEGDQKLVNLFPYTFVRCWGEGGIKDVFRQGEGEGGDFLYLLNTMLNNCPV